MEVDKNVLKKLVRNVRFCAFLLTLGLFRLIWALGSKIWAFDAGIPGSTATKPDQESPATAHLAEAAGLERRAEQTRASKRIAYEAVAKATE